MLKVGIMLRRGPDRIKQVPATYRTNLAILDPAVDDKDPLLRPGTQFHFQIILHDGSALNNLVGPDLRAEGALAGKLQLGVDILARATFGSASSWISSAAARQMLKMSSTTVL